MSSSGGGSPTSTAVSSIASSTLRSTTIASSSSSILSSSSLSGTTLFLAINPEPTSSPTLYVKPYNTPISPVFFAIGCFFFLILLSCFCYLGSLRKRAIRKLHDAAENGSCHTNDEWGPELNTSQEMEGAPRETWVVKPPHPPQENEAPTNQPQEETYKTHDVVPQRHRSVPALEIITSGFGFTNRNTDSPERLRSREQEARSLIGRSATTSTRSDLANRRRASTSAKVRWSSERGSRTQPLGRSASMRNAASLRNARGLGPTESPVIPELSVPSENPENNNNNNVGPPSAHSPKVVFSLPVWTREVDTA